MVALSGDAPNVVFRLIERHQIECDALQSGTLRAAFGARDAGAVRASAEQWIRRDAPVELLESDAARDVTGTERYVCAMLDRRGGQVNPLGYARGLAQAAMQAGAAVHGATPALEVKRNGTWNVRTPTGTVRADKLVLATNGYTDECVAWSAPQHRAGVQRDRRERAAAVGADAVGAVRVGPRHGVLSVRSRKPSADGWTEPAARHQRTARVAIPDRSYAERLWPEMRDVRWSHAWSGQLAITPDHYPHVHEPDELVLVCLGYNGRGVAMSTAMGPQLARRVIGGATAEIDMPITTMKEMPFHALWRSAVTARIMYGRIRDWLGM